VRRDTVQDKPIKRWPGSLLIGFFILVALFCAYQIYDALISDMVLAGRRQHRYWATRVGTPTAYWWIIGMYAAGLLFCLISAVVLALGLSRLWAKR
jgi:hypothetical protein